MRDGAETLSQSSNGHGMRQLRSLNSNLGKGYDYQKDHRVAPFLCTTSQGRSGCDSSTVIKAETMIFFPLLAFLSLLFPAVLAGPAGDSDSAVSTPGTGSDVSSSLQDRMQDSYNSYVSLMKSADSVVLATDSQGSAEEGYQSYVSVMKSYESVQAVMETLSYAKISQTGVATLSDPYEGAGIAVCQP